MFRIALILILTTLSTAAPAHVGVGDTHGFMHGFGHPLGGLDHILAMVAVGLFAAHLDGRALWLVPLTFVSVMAIAGGFGMVGVGLPYVEIGIGLSVVILGLAIAFQFSPPTLVAMGLVGFFPIFHGHAHGAELTEDASRIAYAVGFMIATPALHAVGIGLGMLIGYAEQKFSIRIVQVGGGAMALAGVAILAGIL